MNPKSFLFLGNNLNQSVLLAMQMETSGLHAKAVVYEGDLGQDKPEHWSYEDPDFWETSEVIIRLDARPSSRRPWFGENRVRRNKLKKIVNDFDVVILREDFPALIGSWAKRRGKTVVFYSQGGDLQLLPTEWHHLPVVNVGRARCWSRLPRNICAWLGSVLLGKRQLRSLRQSDLIFHAPYQVEILADLKLLNVRRKAFTCPAVPTQQPPCDQDSGRMREALGIFREKDFVLVQPARQYWASRPWDKFNKRNDVLLMATRILVDSGFRDFCLALVEKGFQEDIQASKELIRSLNLDDQVIWLPELKSWELSALYSNSNAIICDQFGSLPSLGAIGREAALHGRPLVTNYSTMENEMFSQPAPHVWSATSAEQVVASIIEIKNLLKDESLSAGFSRVAMEWANRELHPKRVVEALVQETSQL